MYVLDGPINIVLASRLKKNYGITLDHVHNCLRMQNRVYTRLTVLDDLLFIAPCQQNRKKQPFQAYQQTATLAVASTPVTPELIHQRLGYPGQHIMRKVQKHYSELTNTPNLSIYDTYYLSKS